MRITDIAVSTPTGVAGARPAETRRAGEHAAPALVPGGKREAAHPDEVAASALSRAASAAQAGKAVAAANEQAAASVRGDLLDLTRVP